MQQDVFERILHLHTNSLCTKKKKKIDINYNRIPNKNKLVTNLVAASPKFDRKGLFKLGYKNKFRKENINCDTFKDCSKFLKIKIKDIILALTINITVSCM